jgi:hypothetical protein
VKRRAILVLAISASAVAMVGAGALVLRPRGPQIGDCLSRNGYTSVSCDAAKDQLRIVSTGIAGCDAANHLTVVVKDHHSYCAMDTRVRAQPVVNDGDCVKKVTTSGISSVVKAPCTDKGAHQIVKKIAGSTDKADCPTTAPIALINKTSSYVLCFKS